MLRLALVLVLSFFGCAGWRFSERNDYFTAFNKDNDYTQGLRLEKKTENRIIGFGQDIYTPEHKKLYTPLPGERPYAGVIYADIRDIRALTTETDMYYGATGGLVGPAALGKEAQCGIHALLGQACPDGWHTQLDNEPVATLHSGLRFSQVTQLGYNQTHVTAEAGTLSTALRFKTEVRNSYGRFFWFGGSGLNLVAHDIFLDGNTYSKSTSADKKVFNTELRGGIGWNFDTWSAEWFIAVRSPQFEGQDASYNYGGVELEWR